MPMTAIPRLETKFIRYPNSEIDFLNTLQKNLLYPFKCKQSTQEFWSNNKLYYFMKTQMYTGRWKFDNLSSCYDVVNINSAVIVWSSS